MAIGRHSTTEAAQKLDRFADEAIHRLKSILWNLLIESRNRYALYGMEDNKTILATQGFIAGKTKVIIADS